MPTQIKLVSKSAKNVPGNGDSYAAAVTDNGRYIAFASWATKLLANNKVTYPGLTNVFLKDILTGTVTLISSNSAGAEGHGMSDTPSISSTGNAVVFVSNAQDLVANDTNTNFQVFVKYLITGTTTLLNGTTALVSAAPSRTGSVIGNGFSGDPPVLSSDGLFVAFDSLANNLVGTDTNQTFDVFVKSFVDSSIVRASTTSYGNIQLNKASTSPAISANGRYVAFLTTAKALTIPASFCTGQNVYLKDLWTSAVKLVSKPTTTAPCYGNTLSPPVISEDGRYLAFSSDANNLVLKDTNKTTDVFFRDMATGVTKILSANSSNIPGTSYGNGYSDQPSMSADGRFVAFRSQATNLVPVTLNTSWNIYVRNTSTNEIALLSQSAQGFTADGDCYHPAITNDGKYVAFESYATNLTSDNTESNENIFLTPNPLFR
jgi:Tol biopolymer transport system component